jgi:hypothetical protein
LWGFREDEEGEEEDEDISMAAAVFIFLTLKTSRRKKEPLLVSSEQCKHKQCVADTQLVDFRNADVGLSGALRSGCKHGFRTSSEDSVNW